MYRRILITGGTGSLGQALTRRLLQEDYEKICILSRDEYKQSVMGQTIDDPRLRFFLGDVRDRDRLRRAFQGMDVVVHAAALKQVPALEYNPTEAVRTNVDGTVNVIEAAMDAGIDKVVSISSDKAVNPVNLYGATKMMMEKLCIAANEYAGHKTKFSVVRYGNVMGSRGSVIPFFQKLKEQEIHIYPVTHAEMTRFWITLEQAVDLVLLSIRETWNGNILVPRLPSMRIVDLVRAIDEMGTIQIVGIRPGEKIHESLISEGDTHVIAVDLKTGEKEYKPEPYASNTNRDWLSVEQMKEMIYV